MAELDKPLSSHETLDLISDFESDMTVFFQALQYTVFDKIAEAQKEGWDDNRLVAEVEQMLDSTPAYHGEE